MKIENPYQEICDKLINPLDALSFDVEHPLIEKMKEILHEFRQKSYEIDNKVTIDELKAGYAIKVDENGKYDIKGNFEEVITVSNAIKFASQHICGDSKIISNNQE